MGSSYSSVIAKINNRLSFLNGGRESHSDACITCRMYAIGSQATQHNKNMPIL
jgi:hypothetical protein